MTTTNEATAPAVDSYSGWSNRETWAFMLYVTNDDGLLELAREACFFAAYKPFATTYDVERSLQDWAEGLLNYDAFEFETGEVQPPELIRMSQDIGSLSRINWVECVAALM